jgi:hypothetical protein
MLVSMKRQFCRSSSLGIGAVASASALIFISCASAKENCVYELSEPDAPYYALGSLVTPQSSYVVIDRCTKSADEVRADLLAPARERARAILKRREEDEARTQQVREEGDQLLRERDEKNKIVEAQQHWWSWFWN